MRQRGRVQRLACDKEDAFAVVVDLAVEVVEEQEFAPRVLQEFHLVLDLYKEATGKTREI